LTSKEKSHFKNGWIFSDISLDNVEIEISLKEFLKSDEHDEDLKMWNMWIKRVIMNCGLQLKLLNPIQERIG